MSVTFFKKGLTNDWFIAANFAMLILRHKVQLI